MRRTSLNTVHELARTDGRVVYIGSDPGPGTLNAMKKEFPERFFIEGIAEQHVIGMAAGMALDGVIPYVNTIATFLTRRCLEQTAVDVCLQNLPVRLIANGGGLVYAPLGPTHTAIEDIALMRALPGMTVTCASDADEMRRLVLASLDWPKPMYIRLAKGGDPVVSRDDDDFAIGRAIIRRPIGDAVIVSTGVMTHRAMQTAEALAADGISCGVIHCHTIAPLDGEAMAAAATGARLVVTLEEHVVLGGLGSAVLECLNDLCIATPVLRLGIPHSFVHRYGSQDGLLDHFGLSPAAVANAIRERIDNPKSHSHIKALA